jgi:2-polyprenyl-3-methyl-5-hydroxy-6-metoxy-1,4-benzoquinol methylase
LSCERRDPNSSQQLSPNSLDWDASYRQHNWDYLAGIGETPRYSLVAGYIHKLMRRGHILDAGCGEGVLIDYLDLSRVQYSGFDLSPTAIDRARQRYDAVNLVSSPIETFVPPANEHYDIVVFNEVLSQVEHPIKELERFSAFLKPGGHFIVSLFQGARPQARGAVAARMLETEITARRMAAVAAAEVVNCDTGLRWKVYCLRGRQTDGRAPVEPPAS